MFILLNIAMSGEEDDEVSVSAIPIDEFLHRQYKVFLSIFAFIMFVTSQNCCKHNNLHSNHFQSQSRLTVQILRVFLCTTKAILIRQLLIFAVYKLPVSLYFGVNAPNLWPQFFGSIVPSISTFSYKYYDCFALRILILKRMITLQSI